jgi:hypothetical protein
MKSSNALRTKCTCVRDRRCTAIEGARTTAVLRQRTRSTNQQRRNPLCYALALGVGRICSVDGVSLGGVSPNSHHGKQQYKP